MTMLCTLIRGQMSYTFFQLGGTCPLMSIAWGQMSSYAIFHRGAHVRGGGGEWPTLVLTTAIMIKRLSFGVIIATELFQNKTEQ